MRANINYNHLKESYLFSEIARRVSNFSKIHPETEIIRMGIGDVTLPLCSSVVEAMKQAAEDMGKADSFHGYGPEQGYDFLRERIQAYYAENDVALELSEIFVSDGAKSDLGNILDLFDKENTVLIPDPVYPVYVDTNLMDGRKIIFADANENNGFLPLPDDSVLADIIYICSPNNPTGAVYNREQLKLWVEYALRNHAVILFDAAYESFIVDKDLPRSIFEIDGAKKCAIEFCSLSKTAGFTGTRCGYTVVPQTLEFDGIQLNHMWLRRQTTKFNGVSYIVQKGAEAVFTKDGREQIKENIAYYRKNAKIITSALDKLGIWYTGGKNSPYIWLRCPNGMDSWTFFDMLLSEIGVVGTPGAGFGKNGEKFFRLTAFSTNENTAKAMEKLRLLLEKDDGYHQFF
ncbi:LL-diaminopimelate aminotransferase [uncultured Ruminococcus sp.]|uniref:LL-diaminopimelate aminotransferase n=1 Tax=Massiliimalia timonensis TaxID=1987501 RepID=A0A8J6TT54_9FIRM|nr:LL-diaminopimelate aminotransferase [Massiliimalia timonensis]MBC8609523.1 LL-diaminopimelate aminotransferase [Massiliimalia timonensis]MBS7175065.1 LL-diaminopimelate aminotransferase [Clostridiales bacterium]SCH39672.1 LL-diaminopimelate aminotransferase [uncultured Ruminococcus sp.]SCH41180.1 LL-diaminopimelate aminotransferase [uncultured Clostridium sp.]